MQTYVKGKIALQFKALVSCVTADAGDEAPSVGAAVRNTRARKSPPSPTGLTVCLFALIVAMAEAKQRRLKCLHM